MLRSRLFFFAGFCSHGIVCQRARRSHHLPSPLSFSSGTLSISQATGSTNGYLTKADWASFNSKISLSSLTVTAPLSFVGTALTMATFACAIAEPCGGVVAGSALTAGVGGLLAGGSARATGLTNGNGLFVSLLADGLISGATGTAGIAYDLAGTPAVILGVGTAFVGGGSGDRARQVTAGQSLKLLNWNSAAVSGAISAAGYFGGGSFAVDALGVPASSAAGLVTSTNGAILSTGGTVIVNHWQ